MQTFNKLMIDFFSGLLCERVGRAEAHVALMLTESTVNATMLPNASEAYFCLKEKRKFWINF